MTYLDCSSGNNLTIIQNLPNLIKLISTNYLYAFKNFEIINCENLKNFSVYNCPNILDNSIIKCDQLEILIFHKTSINNLKILMTTSREITNEKIQFCLKLEKLVCSNSLLTDFNHLKNLTYLDCDNRAIILESFEEYKILSSICFRNMYNILTKD